MLKARQLLEYLQHINDKVGAVALVGHTVVGHSIRRHHLLGIGEEFVHSLGRPDDAATLQCRRVAKIVTLARASPEASVETGPHFVSCTIRRVTGAAGLKDFLAALGITLRVRHAGRHEKSRHYSCNRLEAHYHVDTSGP